MKKHDKGSNPQAKGPREKKREYRKHWTAERVLAAHEKAFPK